MEGEPNDHGHRGEDCAVTAFRPTFPWGTRNDLNCETQKKLWICEMAARRTAWAEVANLYLEIVLHEFKQQKHWWRVPKLLFSAISGCDMPTLLFTCGHALWVFLGGTIRMQNGCSVFDPLTSSRQKIVIKTIMSQYYQFYKRPTDCCNSHTLPETILSIKHCQYCHLSILSDSWTFILSVDSHLAVPFMYVLAEGKTITYVVVLQHWEAPDLHIAIFVINTIVKIRTEVWMH